MAARPSKHFCFGLMRRHFVTKLRRKFSNDASRRGEIENFNKMIFYGLPRISYKVHPTRDHSHRLTPVVIAHGMFGSKSNWNTLATSIGRNTGREIITYDARNHGDSEHHVSMSYAAMTNDLVHLLEKLSIDRCVLVGHSMGGKTVMSAALHNSKLVEKLIVVDSAPATSIAADSARKCIEVMSSLDLSKIKDKRDANDALSNGIEDTAVRQFLLTNLIKTPNGFGWRINLRFFKMNIKDLIEFPNCTGLQYEGETLFIGGADSDYISEKEFPEIHNLFPKAQIEHIENAGHWVHSDQPLKFVESVVKFLNC